MDDDAIDAEFRVVGDPLPQRWRVHWFSMFYSLTFYAGCIAIAASHEDAATRGGAVFGAAIFGPMMRFFGQIAEKIPEQEAQQLRRRLLRHAD